MRTWLLILISVMLCGGSPYPATLQDNCSSGPLTQDEIRYVEREMDALSGKMSHVDVLKRLDVWKHYSTPGGVAGAGWISYSLGSCYVLGLYGDLECVGRVKLSRAGQQIKIIDLPECQGQHNNVMQPTANSATFIC